MRIGRRILWLATLAVQAGVLPAGDPEQVTLAVRVYDYAALPPFELENAIAVTQSVFRSAGILIQWAHCSPALKSGEDIPGCEGSPGLILNIVRRPLPGCVHESLGCALQDAGSGRGLVAYVFAQRLEQTVQMGGATRFRLLGFAMAHELGHLLLGPSAHSATGIMQPNCSPQRMSITPGGVKFSDEQAQRMRYRLQAD